MRETRPIKLNLSILVLVLTFAALPAGAEETSPADDDSQPLPLSGNVDLSSKWRRGDHDTDLDLHSSLSVRYGDPYRDRLTASLHGAAAYDLDGDRDTYGFFPFDSAYERYSNPLTARLYHLYADLNRLILFNRVRLGRQMIEGAETLRLDGLSVDTVNLLPGAEPGWELTARAYVGIPVHFWESSPQGDACAGLSAEMLMERTLRLSAHWTWLRDRSSAWGEREVMRNSLLSLKASWTPGTEMALLTRFTLVNDAGSDLPSKPGDLDLHLRGGVEDWGLRGTIRLHLRFDARRDETLEFNDFDVILGRANRFTRANFSLSKSFGRSFEIEGGGSYYDVTAAEGQDRYDRDTLTLFASVRLTDLFAEGLSLSATVDTWEMAGHPSRQGLQGEASYLYRQKKTRVFSLGVGGGVLPYAYDHEGTEIREKVLLFHLTARAWLFKKLRLQLRFRSESDSFDVYYQLGFQVRLSF